MADTTYRRSPCNREKSLDFCRLGMVLPHAIQSVCLVAALVVLMAGNPANGQLLGGSELRVDFTRNVANSLKETNFEIYEAAHESPGSFTAQNFSAFGEMVEVTPAWPNTGDSRVQQLLNRSVDTWDDTSGVGTVGDFLMLDWIGTDTRESSGGHGNYDGIFGTPTFFTISLGNLPAGTYEWLSYHHDVEQISVSFEVDISTNGGVSFDDLSDGFQSRGQESPPAGVTVVTTTAGLSLYQTEFATEGTEAVVLRFAPYSGQGGALANDAHDKFFVMNGFELAYRGSLPPLPGDVNNDRMVDLLDYEIIRDNLWLTEATREMGDIFGPDGVSDGLVDFFDYRLWKQHAETFALSTISAVVPEPANVSLLAISLASLVARRSRRQ